MPAQVATRTEQQKDDRSRNAFRVWAMIAITIASPLAYCVLTSQWSNIVGLVFLFWIAHWYGMVFTYAILATRSMIFPIVALLAVTIILTHSYDNTTTETWQERIGAVARDGWISHATGRGAASHHGGVDHWIMQSHSRALSDPERWQAVLNKFWYLLPFFGISSALIVEQCIFGRQKE